MKAKATGFTLIELNLAIIFVAILMVAVAAVTINVTKINQRGILLKTINQTGREVMDILQRDITTARTTQTKYVSPTGGVGRLCLGTVSYVFNTAEALNGSGILIRNGTVAGNPPVKLVRMEDRDALWCQESGGVFAKNTITATDKPTELLADDIVPIAVHSLAFEQLATSTDANQRYGLAQLQLLIGTNEAETVADGTCKPPTDHDANFDGCVVREFRTIIRTNGATSEDED